VTAKGVPSTSDDFGIGFLRQGTIGLSQSRRTSLPARASRCSTRTAILPRPCCCKRRETGAT
jgi:hypothetical protein